MQHRSATNAATLKSVLKPLNDVAFQAGYLEGAIRTAIIRLEYESPAVVAAELEAALVKAKLGGLT